MLVLAKYTRVRTLTFYMLMTLLVVKKVDIYVGSSKYASFDSWSWKLSDLRLKSV